MRSSVCVFLTIAIWVGQASADQPMVLGDESVTTILLSPSGDRLAMVQSSAGGDSLTVFDKMENAIEGRVQLDPIAPISRVEWIDDANLVLEVVEEGKPGTRLEVVSLSRGISRATPLHVKIGGTAIMEIRLVDSLPDQDHTIAVAAGTGGEFGVYLLDIETSQAELLALAPSPGARFVVGPANAVVAYGTTDKIMAPVQLFKDGSWQPLNVGSRNVLPVRLTKDSLYWIGTGPGSNDTVGLYEHSLSNMATRLVFRDANGDVDTVMFDEGSDRPLAVRYVSGYPSWHYLVEDVVVDLHVALSAALPDEDVIPMSSTRDGSELVFRSSSVQQPDTFFLADSESREIKTLAKARISWEQGWSIKRSRSQVFNVQAPDGSSISLLVSAPRSARGAAPPPMVLLVDELSPAAWSFNEEVKVLNDLGFAVVQIGRLLQLREDEAALVGRKMPLVTSENIKLAVDALRSVKVVDTDRLCLVGRGEGGVGVLETVTATPEEFPCVVLSDVPRSVNLDQWSDLRLHVVEYDGKNQIGSIAAYYRMIDFLVETLELDVERPLLLAYDQKDPFFETVRGIAQELIDEARRRPQDLPTARARRVERRSAEIIDRRDEEMRLLLEDAQWEAYTEQKRDLRTYLLARINGPSGVMDPSAMSLRSFFNTRHMEGGFEGPDR